MKLLRKQSSYREDPLLQAFNQSNSNRIFMVVLSIAGILRVSFGFINQIYFSIIFSIMLILLALWINGGRQNKVKSYKRGILGGQLQIKLYQMSAG